MIEQAVLAGSFTFPGTSMTVNRSDYYGPHLTNQIIKQVLHPAMTSPLASPTTADTARPSLTGLTRTWSLVAPGVRRPR
jgi:hypothetical protein